jgi:predicted Fe-Mo cluster-binding NifX family protein
MMKVAVAAMEPDLNSLIASRLEQCEDFIIIHIDKMKLEVAETLHLSNRRDDDSKTARLLVSHDIDVAITNYCGPDARRILEKAGVFVAKGMSGTARNAVNAFRDWVYQGTNTPALIEC